MTLTFVNSTFNNRESLFADFAVYCAADTDLAAAFEALSPNDRLLVRYVLNIAAHVRQPVLVDVSCHDAGLAFVLSAVPRFLSPATALVAQDAGRADIMVADTLPENPDQMVRPNGWLVLAPGLVASGTTLSGFDAEATLFGWTIWRRTVTAADYGGRIHIIVPTYNHCALLKRCLAHVMAQTVAERIHCIVVDDGSTDGVAAMMAETYPNMTVLAGDGNLWWGGGINMGLAHVQHIKGPDDFVLFLNNDVMLEPETIECLLLEAMRDRATCWATAAVTDENAVASGERGHTLYRFEKMLDALSQHHQALEVQYLFGRSTLMPVEILDHVPAIDTKMFRHYWSDSDFSLRAKAAGYATCITGRTCVRVFHDRETTGTHIDFFETGRGLAAIWTYFTDIKSLGNLKFAWRFHSRHNRADRWRLIMAIVWRGLGNHHAVRWVKQLAKDGK